MGWKSPRPSAPIADHVGNTLVGLGALQNFYFYIPVWGKIKYFFVVRAVENAWIYPLISFIDQFRLFLNGDHGGAICSETFSVHCSVEQNCTCSLAG